MIPMDYSVWADTVKVIPWSLLLQFSVIAVVILVAKKYYDNFSSYFMFRANKDLGKNVKVVIDGKPGYIIHYTWRFIYVKLTDTNNEMIIPITRWTFFTWEVVRNGKVKDKDKEVK